MSSFTILKDTFGKAGSEEKVEGLTVIVDGTLKEMFDKIINESDGYENYSDVLSMVVLKGMNVIIEELKQSM